MPGKGLPAAVRPGETADGVAEPPPSAVPRPRLPLLPDDLARADGHDPEELARVVDRVQSQQADLLMKMAPLGVAAVHVEGLTADGVAAWGLKLGHAAEVETSLPGLRGELAGVCSGPAADGLRRQLDEMESGHRAGVRQLGVLALLACRGVRVEALPLDDEDALEGAAPRVVGGMPMIDEKARRARQVAMERLLPREGLAIVVLGAMHDLGPAHGGDGTEYVRVELEAVRGQTRRPWPKWRPPGREQRRVGRM